MAQPLAFRVPKENGKTMTLKGSIGKATLESDPDLARMMYSTFILNGCQYCRAHLLIRCHLCATDASSSKAEADDERMRLGLREAGDAGLNERAAKWGDRTRSKLMEQTLERDLLVQQYGKDHYKTHPWLWAEWKQKATRDERAINDEFLEDDPEVTQCCYYGCPKPDAEKLLKCKGCNIAKYCGKECQVADWKWEHKSECHLPQFLKDEYAQDRRRNLAGDYRSRDEM